MRRALLVVGVLAALSAGAYVLPGGSILRRMLDARDEARLSTLRVDGSHTFYGAAAKEAAAALGQPTERNEFVADGSLYLRLPGRCRLEARLLEGAKVAAVTSGGRSRREGPELAALAVAVEQLCAVVTVRSDEPVEAREPVEQHLQALGIETRRTSLARFGGEVVYVLGDPAEGKSQLWVYKDFFRPARLRWTDKGGTAWDVRFLDYTSPATGEFLPRSLEVWRGGERMLRFTALQADAKAKLADTLF